MTMPKATSSRHRAKSKTTTKTKTLRQEQSIRTATSGRYHYLNDSLSRILYVILRLGRDAMRELREGSPMPRITQKMIGQTLGGIPPYKLSRDLKILERAGYIIQGEIHEARVKKGEARKIYELDSEKCICCKGTAMMLLELMNYAKKTDEAEVDIKEFLNYLFESSNGKPARLACLEREDFIGRPHAAEMPYDGKLQELVKDGKHVERSSADRIRPRMKIYLEQQYLRLLARYPSAGQVKGIKL